MIPWFALAILVLSTTTSAADLPLEEILSRQAAGLNSILTYHLRITSRSGTFGTGEDAGELTPTSIIEIWQDGFRRREWRRSLKTWTPEGTKVSSDGRGWVSDNSEDPWQTRSLEGWDRERPFPLPLEFGRDAAQFEKVKGYLSPPNPNGIDTRTEGFSLLWTIFPGTGKGLSELARVADLDLVAADSPEQVRLRVRSASDPSLQKYVGATIDLDQRYGYQVCRIEFEDEYSWTVREATSFQEVLPGVWIPKKAKQSRRLTNMPIREVSEWTVDICEINVPIPAEDLTVRFPPGARVNERIGDKIHIWGDAGPVATFTTHEAFRDYIYARAREYQARNRPASSAGFRPEPNLWAFVMVNGGLVAALVGLTFLRRRLARPAAGAAPNSSERGVTASAPDATPAAKDPS